MYRDFQFAARTLANRPGFTALVALTLALGVGSSTAVFSIVHAVLLRPLPYKDPGRLAAIWLTSTREEALAKIFATHADYVQFRKHSRTLESVAAATWATRLGRALAGYGRTREVLVVPATENFFDTLGVHAALGRTFRADDEKRGCSMVLAYGFWASALASDSRIVGGTLTLDRSPCTVLGVMPPKFSFYPSVTQAWVLLGPNYQADVGIFARLAPGATLAQAQSELRSLYRAIHPGQDSRDFEPVVYDLHGEFTFLAGRSLRTTLIVVFAAVLLVLLIACLNVANLLLTRVSERHRELAVRAALGSGQGRLMRQMLTESLLLSGFGACLGLLLAFAAVRYFQHASPIELTVGAQVSLNVPVMLFTVAATILSAIVFGLIPAVQAGRVDLIEALKATGRGSIHGRSAFTGGIVALEISLSFMLMVTAGLLMTSALRMGSEPLGFNPDRVVATRIDLPSSYSTPSARSRFYDRLIRTLERVPGATGVALASRLPPDTGSNKVLEIPGRQNMPGAQVHDVSAEAVSPAFFQTLTIPILRGRPFNEHDGLDSAPVAIVNEALVREYFPHTDPLGNQVRISASMPWLNIVGVSGNIKHTELMNEMQWHETPFLYRPVSQDPRPSVEIAIRTSGNNAGLEPAIANVIASFDVSIPKTEVEPLSAHLARILAYPRFRAVVLAFFALTALLLSAIGLHGVLSQTVAGRTREFGVRRAVGAQTRNVILLVARQGSFPVLAGLAAGLSGALAFSSVLSSLLYGIEPANPAALAAISVVLLIVSVIAMALPARRAARVDPMVALRDE